jgi:hypothetical protein
MKPNKKPKFPLTEKYIRHRDASEWGERYGVVCTMKELEQALSKAEAGTPHKLNSLSYNKGFEDGKKGARLEGMRIQYELEKDKLKVLEGNLEACLDINRQLVAENKKLKEKLNAYYKADIEIRRRLG